MKKHEPKADIDTLLDLYDSYKLSGLKDVFQGCEVKTLFIMYNNIKNNFFDREFIISMDSYIKNSNFVVECAGDDLLLDDLNGITVANAA